MLFRRIFILTILIAFYFVGNAQFVNTTTTGSATTLFKSKGGISGDSGIIISSVIYTDTTAANLTAISHYSQAVVITSSGGYKAWFRTLNPPVWNTFGSGGGSGTVTSIATTNGILGGTITTTGTLQVDSFAYATRVRVQKLVDSLNKTIPAQFNPTVNYPIKQSGTYPNITTYADTATDKNSLGNLGTVRRIADSAANAVVVPAQFNPIQGYATLITGTYPNKTFASDSTFNASRARVQKAVDSLSIVKVNVSDTSTMLSPYGRLNYINTQLATKVNYTDTASMLSPYYRTTTANAALALKVNYTDTASMLNNYLNGIIALNADTIYQAAQIAARVKYSDTAAMLAPYTRSVSGGYLPLSGGTLTGNLNGTTANFTGFVVANGFQSVVTGVAGGSTTNMTSSSSQNWYITSGAPTTTTIVLPNATTIAIGNTYQFNNNATGGLAIQQYGGGALYTVPSGGYVEVILLSNSFSAGQWDVHVFFPTNSTAGTTGFSTTGTINSSGLDTYTSNLGSSYTSRTKVDKNYVDSSRGVDVKYSDTASMLSGYQRKLTLTTTGTSGNATLDAYGNINIPNYTTSLSGVVKYTDTSSMLSPYQRSAFAVKYSDTASMLSPYKRFAVTSVATGFGLSGGTITSTGTLLADTSFRGLTTNARLQQKADSLLNVATHGTVTSVAALTLGTTGTDLSSTVANGTTTPVITLNVPTASASNRGVLSSSDWTTFNNKQSALSGTGFVKISGTTISYDNSTYITGNQTITLSGDISGSGATSITTSIGSGKVTNAMLAGTINYSKMDGSTVPTWNQNTTGSATQWGGYGLAFTISSNPYYTMVYDATASKFEVLSASGMQSYLGLGSMAYASTGSYVPYSGATGDLTMGAHNLMIGAGNYLGYSSTSYMTPEDNVQGAKIKTGGSILLQAGGNLNFYNGTSNVVSFTNAGAATFASKVTIGTGNVATVGDVLNFANNKSIAWRNNANTADMQLFVNGSDLLRYTGGMQIDGAVSMSSTLSVTSTVTASAFYESSDSTLKNITQRFSTSEGFDFVIGSWKTDKTNAQHFWNIAQEVERVYPQMVSTNEQGLKSINYIELHNKEIYDLQMQVEQLKKQINEISNRITVSK
jgi:hypothetical protein